MIKNPCESPRAYKGTCCCNCALHKKLMSHPWHNGLPVTHQMGWVCILFLDMDAEAEEVQISGLHGACECWQEKEKVEV